MSEWVIIALISFVTAGLGAAITGFATIAAAGMKEKGNDKGSVSCAIVGLVASIGAIGGLVLGGFFGVFLFQKAVGRLPTESPTQLSSPIPSVPTSTPSIFPSTESPTQLSSPTPSVPTSTPSIFPSTEIVGEQLLPADKTPGLVLNFEGSLNADNGERGYGSDGLSFVSGHSGQAVLFDKENTLYYLTGNNISFQKGTIEFWLKPLWNGNDNQSYVFFEIGDSWFNRFRITKDGANNFRFMVWSSKVEYAVSCNVDSWVANNWHKVRVMWQNDSISLILDDVICDTKNFVTMPDNMSPRFYVGSSAKQDMQAQSVIDEFIIYP